MTRQDTSGRRRIPAWVWAVTIMLSSIPPFTHFWIAHFPPEGTAPTGLHGGDSAVFIHCMRMFETGFFSPYANCKAARGTHSPGYFAAPFFWIYGAVGAIGRALHVDEFQTLGWANGLGGFAYLLAAYLFLREAFPKQANPAFLLFALGGGPGGILFMVTGALGLHGAPDFEAYFERYAHYQLFEGAGLMPVLLMTRLYYTLPLACCLVALALLLKGTEGASRRFIAAAAVLLFVATLINLRFGPMAWGVFVLYLAADGQRPLSTRARLAAVTAIPVLVAWALGGLMLRKNPAYVAGALATVRTNIWLSPFVAATIFHLTVVPQEVVRGVRRLPRFARTCACAAIGYLVAYLVLYCLYNAYYGNIWRCLDYNSALNISDWALLGAAIGAALGLGSPARNVSPCDENAVAHAWIALWLLGLLAVGISAFGHGWFLRLVPQRLIVFLPLPLAVAAARGIQRLHATRPYLARTLTVVMVTCGVCSIVVASACFQGPLGHRPGRGPFAWTHCELMSLADADALDCVDGGVVLTPVTWGPAMGDVAAIRPNTSTVFGYGALNFTDERHTASFELLHAFFNDDTPEASRKKLVDDWCVDYVYCPDCHPVDEHVLAALRDTPWLSEVTRSGKAVLFRVVPESGTASGDNGLRKAP